MLKTRLNQSPCSRGPPMTANQLRFRASSQKDHLTTNSTGFSYPFTRVTNTKSMTPNQLRFRASAFKGFHHIPLGPCSGFKAKCHDFIFLFLLFFFFLLFLFFSFLEDYIGLQMSATQPYYRLSTYLRPTMQSERR